MLSALADHGLLPRWLRPPDGDEDNVTIPRTWSAVWIERLLWIFLLSFAFDYRASDTRTEGAGIDQILFLLAWAGSTGCIFILGWRFLLVRPIAWFILLWGGFLAYMIGNSVLQGVPFDRWFRMILPQIFLFSGIMNAHIASCAGIRPSRIIAPVFTAACINVIWRIIHGFLFKEVSLETVRIEVQSPSGNWLAAWIGCAILLRQRFHWTLLVAISVLFIGVFITVTRSLLFPVFASALASGFCFLMGIRWGQFQWIDLMKRLLPVAIACVAGLSLLGLAAVVQPNMIERWNERLFHLADDRNLTADISYLTRKAEADSIGKILNEEPYRFINGMGIGASYNWDAAYMPEIFLVFPEDSELGVDVWTVGHSTWSYALFSGGIIALAGYGALVIGTLVTSIRAARANASDPGPDQWLAFLPFIATCCLLSETLTSNPFYIRASWIHRSLPS
jgi:hypothetical protein